MSDTHSDTHSANYSVISGHFDWSSRMHCRNSSLSPETQKLAWKIPSYQQVPRALSQTASRLISLSSTLQTENLKCIVLHLGCGICRNNDLWRSFNLLPRPLKLLWQHTGHIWVLTGPQKGWAMRHVKADKMPHWCAEHKVSVSTLGIYDILDQ